MLRGRHIILGVTGSIAAYKAAMLVRECRKRGADVRVVMTPAAREFITPLTMATLSNQEVIVEMFSPASSGGTWHIHLGSWADCMLIAPASANTIAKLAHGLADNALTALTLALRCPLLIAPAMDVDMYHHPATQANLALLRSRGVRIIEPESGELASGLEGAGRLPEPATLVDFLESIVTRTRDFAGKRFLISAGPTREQIDPVRFLSNNSSGKMGFAIAQAAVERGATVTLIAGPVHCQTPPGVHRIDVTSAEEMHRAMVDRFSSCDVAVMAAAVADVAPAQTARSKMKKETLWEDPVIRVRPTPDILRDLGGRKEAQLLVGFALETEQGLERAAAKLESKNTDLIVLNNPLQEGAGFGVDTNIVTFLTRDGWREELPMLPKVDVAHRLLDKIGEMIAGH